MHAAAVGPLGAGCLLQGVPQSRHFLFPGGGGEVPLFVVKE